MVHAKALTAAAAALLLALPCSAGGLYAKNSPVLQVDAKNYDRLIAKSNHTSVSTETRKQWSLADIWASLSNSMLPGAVIAKAYSQHLKKQQRILQAL
jgi:hypothetical protein